MYLLNVSYTKSLPEVDAQRSAHKAWVQKHHDAGAFLLSGPKKSGLGGIILAKSMPKKDLMAILAEDSFYAADVAEYQISDFDLRTLAQGVELADSL